MEAVLDRRVGAAANRTPALPAHIQTGRRDSSRTIHSLAHLILSGPPGQGGLPYAGARAIVASVLGECLNVCRTTQ
jgi:hypothetical protein